eukprot:scaffold568231_cov18-Prasinocladus_malaysianus.AAC.1
MRQPPALLAPGVGAGPSRRRFPAPPPLVIRAGCACIRILTTSIGLRGLGSRTRTRVTSTCTRTTVLATPISNLTVKYEYPSISLDLKNPSSSFGLGV